MRFFFLLFLVIISFNSYCLDYYWVNNGGDWSDYSNHWATTSGGSTFHASVPTSLDNVIFDANSFNSNSQTVTLDLTITYCNNMDWSNVTNNPSFYSNSTRELKIFGSLTLSPDMSFLLAGDCEFQSNDLGNTITTAGNVFGCTVIFSGIGGEWILQDSFEGSIFLLVAGTFRTNNNYIKCTFSLDQSNSTRYIDMGASVADCIRWTADYSSNGLSVDADRATINITASNGHFTGGDHYYKLVDFKTIGGTAYLDGRDYTIRKVNVIGTTRISNGNITIDTALLNGNFSIIAGGNTVGYAPISGNCVINGNNTFDYLNIGGDAFIDGINTFGYLNISGDGVINGNNSFDYLKLNPGNTYTIQEYSTQTIVNTLDAYGTAGFPIEIVSSNPGVQANFLKYNGVVCGEYLYLSDINAEGGAFYYASLGSDNTFNNSGWIFNNTRPCSDLSYSTINVSDCKPYPSPSGSFMYPMSGTYTDTLPNSVGYDSIITINLTINPIDRYVTQTGSTLTADEVNASYQWFDCYTKLLLENDTNKVFTPQASGRYAVIVSKSGCVDTSLCFTINIVGIAENNIDDEVQIFPNPVHQQLTINHYRPINKIIVFNMEGKAIKNFEYDPNVINVNDLTAGIYFINIITDKKSIIKKFVKE